MKNPLSLMSLILALGVFAAGPVLTPSGPFSGSAAFASSDDYGNDDSSRRSGMDDDDDGKGHHGKHHGNKRSKVCTVQSDCDNS